MRRRGPLCAEVAGRGDDPPAIMPLPEPVDHDPRRQRVRRLDEPFRQRGPSPRSAGLGSDREGRRGLGHEHGRHARIDDRPAVGVLAATEQIRRRSRAARLVEPDGLRAGLRRRLPGRLDPSEQPAADRCEGRAEDDLERRFLDPAIAGLGVEDQGGLAWGPFGRKALEGDDHVVVRPRGDRGEAGAGGRLDRDDGRLELEKLRLPGPPPLFKGPALFGPADRVVVAEPGGGEERLEPVEIGLAERVELVVVAPGAADRQPEEDETGRLGDVVERILPAEPLVVEVDHVGIAAVEPGGDEGRRIVGRDLIPRDLESDELVEGQVAIEGRDDPVAIPPGVGPGLVELEAVGVGVSRQVEPVLCPSLAVMRRGEQTIDDPLERPRLVVLQEGRDLFGRWRKTDQIECNPPDQRRPRSF